VRLGPPDAKAWPPERLFRLLTASHRPRLPIEPLSFAQSIALEVRALRSAEEGLARDASGEGGRGLLEGIVAAAVFADGARVFASARDVGVMLEPDFDALGRNVFAALEVCSPTYGRCDAIAWDEALKRGARHPSNYGATRLLAAAFDWTGGGEQPERYFGVPMNDIADSAIMAYRAAVGVVAKERA
jgi:hypothetical protein